MYANRTRARKWLAPALAVIVVGFLAFSLPPYFTGDTRVTATFALHYPLLVGHVMFASVAMVAAVAQIWPRLRVRHHVLHRRVGRVYVYTAVPAAVCAMVIGAATPFGPFLAVSNVLLASLWLWFTLNGYLAAHQRRFADHRRHMVRSAALALSIITNRIWTPCCSSPCIRCRAASLAVTGSTSCGSRRASEPGSAGRSRCWPCSGGCTADQ